MAQKVKTTLPIPVEAVTHHDTRVNNPPIEMIGFMEEEEQKPKTMRYPRNTELDPQLVWRGKDEQDNSNLAVPIVPIYLQEKIEPRAIIEDLRKSRLPDTAQPSLFEAFAELPFDQAVEFYQHEQDWTNRFILGDALTVMTSLAEKEGLKGKVQCVYLDPPYGIKFGSNWQVSSRKRDVKDGRAEDFTRQPEQIRAFRDTWKDGINSYLAYLRDRLMVARDLLTESGSAFLQIGDENVHLVRCLMDEVFGRENFVSELIVQKTSTQDQEVAPQGTVDAGSGGGWGVRLPHHAHFAGRGGAIHGNLAPERCRQRAHAARGTTIQRLKMPIHGSLWCYRPRHYR